MPSTLQTLKDRDYVRLEKSRFIPEESGRLLTAFLERFFERYVSYDFTAYLEEELDDISGGRLGWQQVLEEFWRDFKPKTGEVMEQKPSEITAALDDFLAPWLFPDKGDGTDPRLCPACGEGRLGLRGGRFGAFVACSNYPDCKFTRRFGTERRGRRIAGPQVLGQDPETGQDVTLRSGRFGPYFQLGEGKEAKRASLPKDVPPRMPISRSALRLLSLPRAVGDHPETGKPITASIGRYGPYLAHDGKYAKLASTAEVFEIGMNAAVAKLADAAERRRPQARLARAAEDARRASAHRAEIRLMEGRFGPYVTDGTTNATLPKSLAPDAADAGGSGAADRRARRQGAGREEGQGPQGAARRKKGSEMIIAALLSLAAAAQERRRRNPANADYHFRYLNGLDPARGWHRTVSGLRYRKVSGPGTGRHPAATDTVTIHYVGRFIDGTEFDSSVAPGRAGDLSAQSPDPRLAGGGAADGGRRPLRVRDPLQPRLRLWRARPDPRRRHLAVHHRPDRDRPGRCRALMVDGGFTVPAATSFTRRR